MTAASANRMGLRIAEQATFDQGAAVNGLDLRYTSESLQPEVGSTQSQEIRADRLVPDLIQTARGASGAINMEVSYNFIDRTDSPAPFSLFEGILLSDASWSAAFTPNTQASTNITVTTPTAVIAGTGIGTGLAVGDWIKLTGSPNAATNDTFCRVSAAATDSITVDTIDANVIDQSGAALTVTRLDYIEHGTTDHFYTLDKQFNDIARYETLVGMGANTSSWQVNANGILTCSIGFVGKLANALSSTIGISATDLQTAQTGTVMTAVTNAKVSLGGFPATVVTGLNFNTTNNLAGRDVVGVLGAHSLRQGQLGITGTVEMLLTTGLPAIEYAKLANQSLSQMGIQMIDSNTQGYIFDVPRLKYSAGSAQNPGINQDIPLSLSFTGILDTNKGRSMRVWRAP